MNRDEIKQNFGEDINVTLKWYSLIDKQINDIKKMTPRTETNPNNINTGDKIMVIANGRSVKVYQNPL